jgi:G:T/U-mismatch repair DNA glycosylase
VVVNDISLILRTAEIRDIYVNGKTAYSYYQTYMEPVTGRKAVCLPSTSPANAAWSLDRLEEAWRIVL